MPAQTSEAKITLAIKAIQSSEKLSIRRAAKLYNIPYSSLRNRMNGDKPIAKRRPAAQLLDEIEEKVIVQHIIDMDDAGFSPRLEGVEDMANYILTSRGKRRVGKLWAHRFVKRTPELKTRFSRSYDFQRALCEDPKLIEDWFQLVTNMKTKYGIQDCDIWNFDETGFMMGIICGCMVITRSDRKGKAKKIQPGNREWATAIACINAEGQDIPPFLVVQGAYHLANWYTEGGLPHDWVVKPTSNGWTDNETGLEWIKHFEKHTALQTKGIYRLLVLDGHESHMSAEFGAYCKAHNIITICLPPHSSHLTQPLDVGCFSVLKRLYGYELNTFIKAHINHITKVEFFIAFHAAYLKTMTEKNIKAGFRGAGLIPHNPQAVILKLDVKLRTPTPTRSPSADVNPWVSQTPHNPTEALSQTDFVKNKISGHQGSSPTPIFTAVKQLAKGIEAIAHELTLVNAECRDLRKANEALSKRKRAKKTHVYKGGALSFEEAKNILTQKEVDEQVQAEQRASSGAKGGGPLNARRCGTCGKTGHNARTCQVDVEMSDVYSDK
jgi:hypothetical protein